MQSRPRAWLPSMPALLLLGLGAGCLGAAPGPAPAGGAATPVPAPGDALAALRQAWSAETPDGGSVSVDSLRFLRVDAERWETLRPEDAATEPRRMAALVVRSCRKRQGLQVARSRRASWYVLEAGRLVAFDHASFGSACSVQRHFAPAPEAAISVERTIRRFIEQRYPESRPDPSDRLRRGIALAEVGRLDDASHWLQDADRTLERLDAKLERPGTEQELQALRQRRDELRTLRALLDRKLREARRRREAPVSPTQSSGP